MRTRTRVLCILCVLFFAISSCDQISSTAIGKITENPRKYAGKRVAISGDVTESFSFFVIKYFVVRDGTGELAVVTSKPLPKKGERIKVRGTVEEAFSIGDKQLLVLVESEGKK
jgi:hypothetical protein